jgi:hypothetical protein
MAVVEITSSDSPVWDQFSGVVEISPTLFDSVRRSVFLLVQLGECAPEGRTKPLSLLSLLLSGLPGQASSSFLQPP